MRKNLNILGIAELLLKCLIFYCTNSEIEKAVEGVFDSSSTLDPSAEMVERPGEIDNSELQGHLPHSLKEGLIYKIDYKLLPEAAWNLLVAWYGGGPEFPRIMIVNPGKKPSVELYPPILYTMVADPQGRPIRDSIIPLIFSATKKLELIKLEICKKFDKPQAQSRLWYRMRGQKQWKLISKLERTLEDLELFEGDFFLLEVSQKGIWPRDGGKDLDENYFEIGDLVDIFLESDKAWHSGTIILTNKGGYRIRLSDSGSIHDLPLNTSEMAPSGTYTNLRSQLSLTKEEGKKIASEFLPLLNIGNTCYMNSILQCLIHSPLFKSYFETGTFHHHMKGEGLLSQSFAELIKCYSRTEEMTPALRRFKVVVGKLFPDFNGLNEQDALEFLSGLLQTINSELTLDSKGEKPSKSPAPSEDEKKQPISVIDSLFCGETITTMICSECGHQAERKEKFYYLCLPIPPEKEFVVRMKLIRRCGMGLIPKIVNYAMKLKKETTVGVLVDKIRTMLIMPETTVFLIKYLHQSMSIEIN